MSGKCHGAHTLWTGATRWYWCSAIEYGQSVLDTDQITVFYIPTGAAIALVSPADAATVPFDGDSLITIDWSYPSACSNRYNVYVGLTPETLSLFEEGTGSTQDSLYQNVLEAFLGSPVVGETLYWKIDYTDSSSDTLLLEGPVWSFTVGTGTAKAENPTPADGSGPGIDFGALTMTWENPASPDDYDVYIGPASDDVTLVSADRDPTSYTTSLLELEVLFGTDPIDAVVYWRVDSNFAGDIITGDVWSFDPRPGKTGTPAPANAAEDVEVETDLGWSAGAYADTYHAYAGIGSLPSLGDPTDGLSWTYPTWTEESAYSWRADSINEFGTTTGDTWTFTTTVGGGGGGGGDPPGGGGGGHGGGDPPGSADADSPSGTATIVSQMIMIIESDE